ncbi:MAG: molybdopterin-dependent oxidoreductase, partial [Coriobacteriia bacterium]|nr:molybdopterin-dependent oxidoreductase [Coriobacteriia bacterium]
WDFLKTKSIAPYLRKEDGTFLRLSDLGLEPEGEGDEAVDAEVVWDEDAGTYGSVNTVANPAVRGSYEIEGVTYQTVLDYVLEGIKEYTVEKAAEVCDLPKEKIEEVAELYATAKPAAIANYQGTGHYTNSRHFYKNIMLLACLTGNYNQQGSFLFYNILGEAAELDNAVLPGVDVSELVKVEGGKTEFNMSSIYFPQVMETGKLGDEEVPIKVAYIMQANPMSSDCGTTELKEAFDKLDLLVVADPYMSDTARYADIVLPIAMTWEKEDSDGGFSLLEKAVEPAGECKTDMDVFRLLADAMGYDDLYPMSDEEYLRAALDTPTNRENGSTYDDYKEKRVIVNFAEGERLAPGTSTYAGIRNAFYIENPTPRNYDGREIDWDLERRPCWEEAVEASVNSPEHEKYPLFAFSIHEMYQGQSVFSDTPWLNELRVEPQIDISEEAALARGIKQGDMVRAFNDRGSVVLKAHVTKGIRPDCVRLPHGPQIGDFVAGHNTDLTRQIMDPMSGNSCYNDILCEVELYDGGAE